MKFLFFILTAYCFCSAIVSSSKTGGYKEAIKSCNTYIDTMLKDVLEEHGDYFDPHPIKESLLIFKKKVVFVDFNGEVKLTEGYISGISNLHRVSSCSLSFENGRLRVSAKLEIEKMLFNFTGSLRAININNVISVKGNTSKVFGTTAISLDAEGKGSILEDLNLNQFSNLTFVVGGMRLLGWMEDPMKTSLIHFFKAVTEKLVETEMKKLLIERMKEHPFSLEHFEIDIGDITDQEITTTEDDTLIGELVYTKEDSNSYIDSILENRFLLEAEYIKLERLSLPDDRIDNVYVSTKKENYMDLKNGYVDNLIKARRIQDCSQPVKRASNVTFTCFLGFPRIQILYSAASHDGNVVSNFEIVTLVDATRLGIKITTTVNNNVPSLLDLNINNLGKFTVKSAHTIAGPALHSESVFDRTNIVNHFSETLRSVLLGKFREILSYSIYKTPVHFVE